MGKSTNFLADFFLEDPITKERCEVVNLKEYEGNPKKIAIITQSRQQKKDNVATRHLIETTEIEYCGPVAKSIVRNI